MKKILFPTDFSVNAMNAFNYALNIANRLNASIITLHTFEMPKLGTKSPSSTVKEIQEYEIEDQFSAYRKAADQMRSQAEGADLNQLTVTHLMKEGNLVDIVKEMVAIEKPDLIIMGTKGASGLKQLLMGSNTAKVIEAVNCPILAVPQSASYKPIKRIAYATNLETLDHTLIPKAYELAQALGAKMYIFHVNVSHSYLAYDIISAWQKRMSHLPDVYFEVLESNDVFEGIQRYIKRYQIDVLAMLTHKRTFLNKLFTISYTQKMAFHTDIPLLAYEF